MPFDPNHRIVRLTADFEVDPKAAGEAEEEVPAQLARRLQEVPGLGFMRVVDWQSVEYE